MDVFAPPPIPDVFARCENLSARQGPSQRPRECEKCGLAWVSCGFAERWRRAVRRLVGTIGLFAPPQMPDGSTGREASHGAIGTRRHSSHRSQKREKFGLGPAIHRVSLALAGFGAVVPPLPGSLPTPVSPTCITSPFGPRVLANRPFAGTYHYGVDLRAPLGTAVRAIAAGQIIGIDRRTAGGLEVRVQHPGFVALYAHLGSLTPALLQGRRKLDAGEKLAVVGYSGLTYGPHLYFEIIIDGHRVDPAPYLNVTRCP